MSKQTLDNEIIFNETELHLLREWFNAVQDLSHPDFLKQKDYQLAYKIYKAVGQRVPESISSKIK